MLRTQAVLCQHVAKGGSVARLEPIMMDLGGDPGNVKLVATSLSPATTMTSEKRLALTHTVLSLSLASVCGTPSSASTARNRWHCANDTIMPARHVQTSTDKESATLQLESKEQRVDSHAPDLASRNRNSSGALALSSPGQSTSAKRMLCCPVR